MPSVSDDIHLSSKTSHVDITSESLLVLETSDEEVHWAPADNRASIMDIIYSDRNHLSTEPYFRAASQRPTSVASPFHTLRGRQIDPRKVKRHSYMDDYQDFDAKVEENLHNQEGDDDDDNLTGWRKDQSGFIFWDLFSIRGVVNMGTLGLLALFLLSIFLGIPIYTAVTHILLSRQGASAMRRMPPIDNLSLIDPTTPQTFMSRKGINGTQYDLVFSDEFSTDGRTFWPGDDPYWEAVDLHYWPTHDMERFDPDAITTNNGYLNITIAKEALHDQKYRSGMLQSWNKFCFTGGLIEISVSLPGSSKISGFWPAAWTMGNLGRAGYGSTTDGTWPYSYNSCDTGILKSQTNVTGTGPVAALNAPRGGHLSALAGQRLSSCTCPGGDHPGPDLQTGRGSPEIDIIEAQISHANVGQVSQSVQFAPFDDRYSSKANKSTIYNNRTSSLNEFKGSVYQEAVSVLSTTDQSAYQATGGKFQKFAFEYTIGPRGSITWFVGDNATWSMDASAVGPNPKVHISQRVISEEPMYIILNLAMSESFSTVDTAHMQFPARMLVDYVRVYQKQGQTNIGCSPKDFPTEKYINDHIDAYTNANLTTWEQTGYPLPKNSLTGC